MNSENRLYNNSATDILKKAAEILTERGKTYDKSGGTSERSMEAIVKAFNIITGKKITEQEGWMFMCILKQVRYFANPEIVHEDSIDDLVSYAALFGESCLKSGNKT